METLSDCSFLNQPPLYNTVDQGILLLSREWSARRASAKSDPALPMAAAVSGSERRD